MSDEASANSIVEQIGAERALAVQADASSIDGIEKLVSATVAKFGKIDVVFANAASMVMRDLESTTEADFDRLFSANVKGPYFLCQVRFDAAINVMTEHHAYLSTHDRKLLHISPQVARSFSFRPASAPFPVFPLATCCMQQLKAPSSR